MGATWEAISNYIQIGMQKIEASLDDTLSDSTSSSTLVSKKKKKAKGKTNVTTSQEVDLDMDLDDAAMQTRFKK
jgi:hypothetical protein